MKYYYEISRGLLSDRKLRETVAFTSNSWDIFYIHAHETVIKLTNLYAV